MLTRSARSQIKDALGNDYGKPRDLSGETRTAFNALADSAFDVCFENILTSQSYSAPHLQKSIELDSKYMLPHPSTTPINF